MRNVDPGLENLEEFDAFSRSVTAYLKCDMCLVSIVSQQALMAISQAVGQSGESEQTTPLRDAVAQHTIRLGRSLMVRDVAGVGWLGETPEIQRLGVGAYLGVPLQVEGLGIVGAICALSRSVRLWTAEDLSYLKEMAGFVTGRMDRDLLRFERDALSNELNETDRIIAMLSRSRSQAVTVHDRDGAVVFANLGAHAAVATNGDGGLDIPWDQIAKACADDPVGEMEVLLDMVGKGPTWVAVSYACDPDGLVLCDWWLAPD